MRQGDALLEAPVRFFEVTGPQLGDAQVDQRQRPQVLAEPEPRLRGVPGGGQQLLRLPGHGLEVPALAGQPHAHDGEDHLRAPTSAGGYRFQSPGGESQVPFGLLQRSPGQLDPGHPRRQLGIPRDHAGREPGQELVPGGAQPAEPDADPVVRQQAGGQVPVLRRLGVADRLDRVPAVRVPPGGDGVQRGQFGRRAAPQLQLQQVGEQLMVAEPGPPRVQRDHERACLLELLQDPLPARALGQQVGQFAVHPLQHRGPQQQPPDRLGLPLQHLGQQVLRDRALAAGELGREPVRIRVPGQRQRRQPQPRRPALGPVIQPGQRRIGERYPRRREQRPRLLQGEAQVGRADLGELALQPQPVQAQPQITAGGQHEPQPRRPAHHQQLQLAQRLVRAQLVHVVHDQPEPGPRARPDRSAAARPPPSHPDRAPPSAAAPASTRPPCPAARRAPTARTAAGHAPHPAPAPTPPAPPGRSRRSKSAAGASSRFPPAPTPRSRALPGQATRKARTGR